MSEDQFFSAVLSNPVNATILARLPGLGLDDAWLVSGALFQTAWNVITDRDPRYGIRDYDIFYFDPDTSYEAEDRAIKRARDQFTDLGAAIELRNQARVHLWYPEKFGMPYPQATRATDGIDRFLMHNAQVGIRPSGNRYVLYAPHGLSDVARMIVRPNRTTNFRKDRFDDKALRWKSLWPELTILEA